MPGDRRQDVYIEPTSLKITELWLSIDMSTSSLGLQRLADWSSSEVEKYIQMLAETSCEYHDELQAQSCKLMHLSLWTYCTELPDYR